MFRSSFPATLAALAVASATSTPPAFAQALPDVPGAASGVPGAASGVPGAASDVPGAASGVPGAASGVPGAAPGVPPPKPPTAEIQLSALAGGQGSAWRSDVSGFVGLRFGFRFKDIVAPYLMLRAGYGNTDQRVLELLQLGVQVWAKIGSTRPYARFGLVHQHEEPWSAVKADPWGALLGVGDGIRHRGGFEGGLGVDIPFKRHKGFELHATVEAVVTGFPDPRGPAVYGGGIAGLGFNYGL